MNLRFLHRVAALFRRDQLDGDLAREMSAHLDLAIEENRKAGMSPEEARRRALIQFGGTQQAKENQRESRSLPIVETLLHDLRYTFRSLRKDRGFAAVAILILALGIYGVISYSVTRQTQEIGIRMALGATPGIVQRGVLGRTLKLALIGIAVGAVVSFVVSKLIASLLFKTDSNDPLTFAGVTLLLVLVALLAGYFPALRATRIDPTIALRSE